LVSCGYSGEEFLFDCLATDREYLLMMYCATSSYLPGFFFWRYSCCAIVFLLPPVNSHKRLRLLQAIFFGVSFMIEDQFLDKFPILLLNTRSKSTALYSFFWWLQEKMQLCVQKFALFRFLIIIYLPLWYFRLLLTTKNENRN
jgi:hypothetical protein